MSDATQSSSLWDFVGPAIQGGAGIVGALGGSAAASGGYGSAVNANQAGVNTSGAVLSPYSSTGSAAESALASLYGLGGTAPNYSAFTSSPGYQFQVQQGTNAINRAAAASGNAFSSTTLAQLGNYNSGLAATQYQQYLQNLYGLTQTGAGAASAQGAQAVTGANNIGTQYGLQGKANASGIAGAAGAIGNLGGAAGKLFGSNSNSPDTSGIGTYVNQEAGNSADYVNSNFTAQPISVPYDSSGVHALYGQSPGTTTYYGDDDGP
jgi:hypothetical protein